MRVDCTQAPLLESPTGAAYAQSPSSDSPTRRLFAQTPPSDSPTGRLFAQTPSSDSPTGRLFAQTPPSDSPTRCLFAQTPPSDSPMRRLFAQTPPSDFFRGDDVARWPRSEHPAVGLSRSGAAIGARGSRPILCGAPVGPFDVSAGSTAVRGKKCCEGRRRLPAPRAASDIYPFTLVLSQKRLCP